MLNALRRLPRLGARRAVVEREMRARLAKHARYVRAHGEDMPLVRDWQWQAA